jgi:hypothetical protein
MKNRRNPGWVCRNSGRYVKLGLDELLHKDLNENKSVELLTNADKN